MGSPWDLSLLLEMMAPEVAARGQLGSAPLPLDDACLLLREAVRAETALVGMQTAFLPFVVGTTPVTSRGTALAMSVQAAAAAASVAAVSASVAAAAAASLLRQPFLTPPLAGCLPVGRHLALP